MKLRYYIPMIGLILFILDRVKVEDVQWLSLAVAMVQMIWGYIISIIILLFTLLAK